MSVRNANSYLTRVHQVAFGFLFVAVVAVSIRSMMFGSYSRALGIVMAFAGLGLIIALKERYWVLLPLLTSSGISIPALPFNGGELGCLLVIATHFLRLGLKADAPGRLGWDILITLPVFLWIMFVFLLNPVGLAMFGSSTIGGRFYFRIIIGFFALCALSSQRIDESGAKMMFFAFLFGMIFSLLRGVAFPSVDPDDAILLGEAAEVSSRYAFVGCANIYMLLFSRYALSDVLRSFVRMFIFMGLGLLTIYSGKRRAFGTLALVPVLRVFLVGRQKALTALVSGFFVLVMAFAIAGDGTLYRLPLSARRALSVIVPKYATSSAGGIHDYFRENMREQARLVIRESPWLGRKGFAMNYNETAWMNFSGTKTDLFVGHAYAGNWHSTWYAYAADFGLPCMLLWAFFTLYLIRFTHRACRTVSMGVWLPTCCLYLSLSILVEIAFSYTSGHSANTSFETWCKYGLLLAVVRGYQKINPVEAS